MPLSVLAGKDWLGKSSGFPENFETDVKSIYRQMMRCYAHLYHGHWLDPFWERFHGVRRPAPPTADDALAVLTELGIEPEVERWTAGPRPVEAPDVRAARVTRRLCLPPERVGEVAEALATHDGPTAPPAGRVTFSWRT